jgi:hypothetical protein
MAQDPDTSHKFVFNTELADKDLNSKYERVFMKVTYSNRSRAHICYQAIRT